MLNDRSGKLQVIVMQKIVRYCCRCQKRHSGGGAWCNECHKIIKKELRERLSCDDTVTVRRAMDPDRIIRPFIDGSGARILETVEKTRRIAGCKLWPFQK